MGETVDLSASATVPRADAASRRVSAEPPFLFFADPDTAPRRMPYRRFDRRAALTAGAP